MTAITKVLKQSLEGRTIWTLSGKMQPDSTTQTVDVLTTPFRIGRRPDLELSVGSMVVSGKHVELRDKGGILCLHDLGSTNGTFVNGEEVTSEMLLAEGDLIEVGDVHLRVGMKRTFPDTPVTETDDGVAMKTRHFIHGAQESARGLQELFDRRQLGPCFQPIHNLSDRDIHGYEFRRSEVAGVSNPAQMFAAAEVAGREVELSMLCREQGLVHCICLPSRLPLFLNTHPRENLLEDVVPQMRILREQWPTRPLVVEIHEKAIMAPGAGSDVRAALKEIDVRLAFDDFGAGQARIRELICTPSDYIKFDAALIRDLQEVSKEQFNFFKAIIHGVQGEGALTVAEGIESEEMIDVCQEIGFDLLQGFALSRPAIMSPTLQAGT